MGKDLRRAGIGPRREARRRTWETLKHPFFPVSTLVGLIAAPVLVLLIGSLQEAVFHRGITPATRWFLIGAMEVSVVWAIWSVVGTASGSVSWHMGADAEEWTARVLRDLGPLWQVEHSVPLLGRTHPIDIDHVAMGPYGVLVVETKWTSKAIDLDAAELHKDVQWAIKQVSWNARDLAAAVPKQIDVIPVVVYWGSKVLPPAEPRRRVGDVRIVAGRKADEWRPLLSGRRVDSENLAIFAAAVQSWRAEEEERTVGTARDRHLHRARRLSRISVCTLGAVTAIGVAGWNWKALGRVLSRAMLSTGGAAGGVLLLLPLFIAVAGLGFVHVARRVDPNVPWWRGSWPIVAWAAVFAFLGLVA